MKRKALVLLLGALALPLGAQEFGLRADIQLDVPLGFNAITESGAIAGDSDTATALIEMGTFVLPTFHLGIGWKTDNLQVSAGLRGITFLVESLAWPNLLVDYELGPVVLEGQVGGGAFIAFGLMQSANTAAICIPDISVWFKLNDGILLGGGGTGFIAEGLDAMPIVWYLGLRLTTPGYGDKTE